MAQGMLMCDLVKWARQGVAEKSLVGDVIDLALAGYNCGRGCVQSAGGVPSAGQAHDYPQLIRAKIPKYAAAPVVTSGGWALPLAKGTYTIGSGYGPRGGAFHYGVDLMANKGVPIFAAAAGTVIVSTCNASTGNCDVDGSPQVSGCGWYVEIRHAGGLYTTYCHMVRRPYVSVGQTVAAGQPLGHVGSSGNSSGPHCHFEVHVNNPGNAGAIEPISFLRSAGLNP
jgi:murein DD-endopeptidase MepM/ murein hydrolase activator NlpD